MSARELQPHDLDGAQRLGAAIRFDGPVEHLRARDCERSAIVSGLSAADAAATAASRMRAMEVRSMTGTPVKTAITLGDLHRPIQWRCGDPCDGVGRT